MNYLNLLCLISLCSVILGEQLYHREGRFIDVSINRYKTNLPSIHDIANTFIHYRMPITVFIPAVRLNLRSKQKRVQYSSFSTPKSQSQDTQNKYQLNEQENQFNNIKQEIMPSNELNSRNNWAAARSLTNPKSNYKPTRNEQIHKKLNLNYANLPESNVDLIPFLYSDKMSKPVNLLNSQYQLSNSNPNSILNQHIAYIQPNSLAPFQPNILILPSNQPNPILNNDLKKENQSLVNLPDTVKANQSKPILESSSIVNNSTSEISQFDISQVGTNPTDIESENGQFHESLDNVPVIPVQNEINNTTENIATNLSANNLSANLSVNNLSTNSIKIITNSSSPTEQLEKKSDQLSDLNNSYILTDSLLDQLKSRLNKKYDLNSLKQRNLITSRSHRSLSVDMPSVASYLTAAVAQSGHTNEQRKILYTRFLDNFN